MKNKGCAVQIFLVILIVLILTQCSCMSAATLPTVAVTIEDVNKDVLIHTPPAPTQITKVICLTADTVYMRAGAGTGYEAIAVLSAGDTLTLTGELVVAPDMGLWWPVRAGELDGFINARYVCK